MKQTLVIGSTVVDLLLSVPALPRKGDDVNISAAEYRIGGCAYNVFKTLRSLNSPALLCSPVGSGVYGRMVSERLKEEGLEPFVSLEQENGCCYCLVEPDGERSFLSHHGAEYLFSRSWMKDIDFSLAGSVYISGIEVEDQSGAELVDFVYEKPELELFFAPGPRVCSIPRERMEGLLGRRDKAKRGPLLHLNEKEALSFSGRQRAEDAAELLAKKTNNAVVITLGAQGCYCLSGSEGRFVPAFPSRLSDTVGAGDTHCGALIASLKEGMSLEDACEKANRVVEREKGEGKRE